MQHFLDTWKFNVRYGGFARYVLFGHFFNEEIMEVKKGNPAAGLPRFAGFERSEVSAVSALHVVFFAMLVLLYSATSAMYIEYPCENAGAAGPAGLSRSSKEGEKHFQVNGRPQCAVLLCFFFPRP